MLLAIAALPLAEGQLILLSDLGCLNLGLILAINTRVPEGEGVGGVPFLR